ncbi:MAG TPA: hypothetical protein VGM62_03630 [Chthoniobacterales bacterium]
MTTKRLLLVATLASSLALPSLVKSEEIRIEVGDRPYHTHGARYWEGDWEMLWVPGHWSEHGHHWVHGHYRRGEHHHHHHDEYHHDGH